MREVTRKLDALNNGLGRLSIYAAELSHAAELSPAAIDAVRKADDVARYQLVQLQRLGRLDADLAPAAAQIEAQLAGERPWGGASGLDGDLAAVVETYREAGRAILSQQESAVDGARGRIMRRDGFATLTADQSHHALRPIADALVLTDDVAVSPAIDQLRDAFDRALPSAEREADDRLDAILSEGSKRLLRKLPHNLGNRELGDGADLDRALGELRERMMIELAAGHRVRLV